MKLKATDYIAHYLHAQGVTHVFELVGGMITFLVDSIHQHGKIALVSVQHEQAAAFAAEGMGRMTGVPGVAMATSGPGATNLLTAVGSCYFDSSPAVFITGQVNRHELRGDRAIRQLGFQETDIVAMAGPITKAAWRVERTEDIPVLLERAFVLACSGRPGPVLLDIPMDVQRGTIELPEPELAVVQGSPPPPEEQVAHALRHLAGAERPLIIAGGGIRAARAVEQFRRFAERTGVPAVHSLLAVDVLGHDHPLRVGMLGSYGNRWSNLAVDRADVLLVLGSRLDIRQTGADTAAFKGPRTIYHVDCEPGEINNRVLGCEAIEAELPSFFAVAEYMADPQQSGNHEVWVAELAELRRTWPDTDELRDIEGINPNVLMHELSAASRSAAAYVVDVGQHQMWAAQSLDLEPHQRFLTSGGMGAMGFGLPAAIGAAMARPGCPVTMIAGDGSFQLNIQELQTVVRNELPLKMVVVNNHCHGMVRQFQQSYFDERYPSTLWGYSTPDFAKVAAAYGVAGRAVGDPADLGSALEWLWRDPQAPALLEVTIDTLANAYPKLAFGLPITEMEPLAQPIEMEST
jgi:acetolactate synthase I/II/III large subunit